MDIIIKPFNNLNILEIGVNEGKSLYMWKKYFKNSNIYGISIKKNEIDINTKSEYKIFNGELLNEEFLKKICNSYPIGFDIIIDGRDTNCNDRIEVFEYLFSKMNPGGIYIIENLQISYSKTCDVNFVDYFKGKIDDVNYHGQFEENNFECLVKKGKNFLKYERLIYGMSFHAGICFIFKRFCR